MNTAIPLAAAHLAFRPLIPVLFPDTCAFLDIIRLPTRQDAERVRRELEAAHAMLNAATISDPRVRIVISQQVVREWNENVDAVEKATLADVDAWSLKTNQFSEVLTHFGRRALPTSLKPEVCLAIADLRNLAQDLIATAVTISDDDQCMINAMRRVTTGEAPARQGGQAKDCVVVEHVLATTRILRNEGACSTVFLSSNTKDYRESTTGSRLRSPLDSEFGGLSLTFCTDWAWAKRELGL